MPSYKEEELVRGLRIMVKDKDLHPDTRLFYTEILALYVELLEYRNRFGPLKPKGPVMKGGNKNVLH